MTNPIHFRCRVYCGLYVKENLMVSDPTKALYVFGDNCHRMGTGGQAIIRGLPSAYGIVTKRSPGYNEADYFEDNNLQDRLAIEQDINNLEQIMLNNPDLIVYFPSAGIGTGLSAMPSRCPKLFKYMVMLLKEKFGVSYELPEPLQHVLIKFSADWSDWAEEFTVECFTVIPDTTVQDQKTRIRKFLARSHGFYFGVDAGFEADELSFSNYKFIPITDAQYKTLQTMYPEDCNGRIQFGTGTGAFFLDEE